MQVLVVMLSSNDSRMVARFLRGAGMAVSERSNAEAACAYVRQNHPDVIVCGEELLDGNAVQLYRQVRAIAPELPMVFLSDDPYYIERFIPVVDQRLGHVVRRQSLEGVVREIRRLTVAQ